MPPTVTRRAFGYWVNNFQQGSEVTPSCQPRVSQHATLLPAGGAQKVGSGAVAGYGAAAGRAPDSPPSPWKRLSWTDDQILQMRRLSERLGRGPAAAPPTNANLGSLNRKLLFVATPTTRLLISSSAAQEPAAETLPFHRCGV